MKLNHYFYREWRGTQGLSASARYGVLTKLLSLVLALTSGLGLVYTKYLYRQYASDLHEAKMVHKNLQLRYDQLLEDYSRLNNQAAIRDMARAQGMVMPDQQHTRIMNSPNPGLDLS